MLERFLISLLRHQAVKKGLKIDSHGFVAVDDIIGIIPSLNIDKLRKIVDSDDKQRMEIIERDGTFFIRAVQGHSIELECPILEEIDFLLSDAPKQLIHGTNLEALESIKTNGLSKMNRTHIHFSDSVSRVRSNSQALIFINIDKARAENIRFFKSKNGIILSEGINGVIDCRFFTIKLI
jgi:2'-phosphotransferase